MKNARSANPVSPYCTGCGACIPASNGTLKMGWDEFGFLVPQRTSDAVIPPAAIDACPFTASSPQAEKDEDVIAAIHFPNARGIDSHVGRYEGTYIGYSPAHRMGSSSGGLATYVLEKAIERGIAKYAFVVEGEGPQFSYKLVDSADGVTARSKTRYYPVTLEEFFKMAGDLDGPVAVTGVACFVKAIRIRQAQDAEFSKNISLVVGIICGGLKSRSFTEYLADSAGAGSDFSDIQYRIKDLSSSAGDYSFGAKDSHGEVHTLKMKLLGDMWGTGMFKAKACDFCTDVLTELADISLGDAWLPELRQDGSGNSVIVTRSAWADSIVREGIADGSLTLDVVPPVRIADSQRASFAHRWNGLSFRAQWARLFADPLPYYRKRVLRRTSPPFALVQILRNVTRSQSLTTWKRTGRATLFNARMKKYQNALKTLTKINHWVRRI